MLDTHLIIGQILKPQGVRGEVKVKPITCDLERFAETASPETTETAELIIAWQRRIFDVFRILGEGLTYESAMALLRVAKPWEGVKVMP